MKSTEFQKTTLSKEGKFIEQISCPINNKKVTKRSTAHISLYKFSQQYLPKRMKYLLKFNVHTTNCLIQFLF